MYKKYLENRITLNEGDYKCYLCHCIMKQSFNIVEEHLLSGKHQERLNQIDEEKRKKETDKLCELTRSQCKRIIENLITFDRSTFLLNCHVCKCKINGLSSTLQHINGYSHTQNLMSSMKVRNKLVAQKEKDVSSNKVTVSKVAIEKPVSVHASIPVLPSELNDTTYDEHKNSQYCNICKTKIIAAPNISQHTQGLLHQALESKAKISTSSSKSDCIVYDQKSNSYYCTTCKYKINSTPDVAQHIQGFLHQKAKNIIIVDGANQGILKSEKVSETQNVGNKNEDKVSGKINDKSEFTEICCCKHCQVFMETNTVLKCHVLLHLYEELNSLENLDLLKFELKSNNIVDLKCLLCDSVVCKTNIFDADEILDKHLKSNMHLGRLHLFNNNKTDFPIPSMNGQISDINLGNLMYNPKKDIYIELLCNVCDVPVVLFNKKEHASGKNHKKKMFEAATSYTSTVKKTEFNSMKNVCYYTCLICDESFSEISNLIKHYKTLVHQCKIISLNMINKCHCMKFIKKEKLEIIECSSCKIIVNDLKAAIDHMLEKNHNEEMRFPIYKMNNQENIKTASLAQATNEFERLSVTSKVIPRKLENSAGSTKNQWVSVIKVESLQKIKQVSKYEASNEELNQLGFSTENILIPQLSPNKKDNVLDGLISLDFNHTQTRKLPSLARTKTPRAPKMENKQKSFATTVLENGKDYITYCVDSGLQNIYNFDDKKISLLELGVNLTYPYHSNRICFPCEQHFPDNVQSLFEHLQSQKHFKNICDLQIDDKGFEDYPDQFSHLRLAKLYMHVTEDGIQCHACNVQIADEDGIIRQHIEESVHKEKSKLWKEESKQLFNQYFTIYKDIWYYAEVFFCEICKKKCEFEMDFVNHLISLDHMKNELKYQGLNLTYDLCPSCITYWFGKTDSYELHCKSNFHKRFATNKDFMVPNLTVTASEFLNNIDENADFLESESNKVIWGTGNKESVLLKVIVETVKPKYPYAEAYIFGSRLSHSAFPDSDVDVFLDCEDVYCTSSTQKQSQEYIKSVKNFFEDTPDTWLVDEVLLGARVPIMKLRHIPTNLKCDISFINGLGVEKSSLIGLYNAAFPICRKMILFMKKWLIFCRIFGPEYITTFAISWCVIFYLQLQSIVPSVHVLIKLKKKSEIVDGWQCGLDDTFSAKNSNLSFKEHLKGFFTYFANFDYQKRVICPFLGKPIDKSMFVYEYTDQLPTEMDIYKERLENKEIEIFRFDSPMCIQDPLELSQNITKAVKKRQLRCFRQYSILSAEKC